MRRLKGEEFRHKGTRYTVAFMELPTHVEAIVTEHADRGYKPRIVGSAKAPTKSRAYEFIKREIRTKT